MAKNKLERRFHWLNYFRPSLYLKSFMNLNIFMLRKSNCKLLICDLDNTLSPHFNRLPSRRVLKFREELRKNNIKFVIASNNSKKRVSTYTKLLQPDGVVSFAMKPLKFKILRLMKRMNFKPEETVIMGDQFITDIWVANRIECRSILVLPIVDPKIDNSIKLTKFLEKHIYKRISNNSFNEIIFDNSGVLSDELQVI